jgi:hypothetical protein
MTRQRPLIVDGFRKFSHNQNMPKYDLANASTHQREQIQKVTSFIEKHAPDLNKMDGDSKWTDGAILYKYDGMQDGFYVFMVGPISGDKVSWHMMPLYGVLEFQDKYQEDLKPFEAGKSCINFKNFDDLPLEALEDIVSEGTKAFFPIWEKHRKK